MASLKEQRGSPSWVRCKGKCQAPPPLGLTVACLPLQDQKIYIYSLKGMCPLSAPQQALDTPAIVTSFLAVPVIKKVR